MNKHLVHVMALVLLPCLFTEQLAEPAFSDPLMGGWQMGVRDWRSPMTISQEALAGRPTPDAPIRAESPWRRGWMGKTPVLRALPEPRVSLNGWIANFNPKTARRALRAYTPYLNELSIFGVAAKADGRLAPETDFIDASLAAVKRLPSRPRVLLTVANIRPQKFQDHELLQLWIGSKRKRMRHIADLLKLVGRADGLDIDYENLRRGDGPQFSQFVIDLGRALHARGKWLTVTVEHQTFTHGDIDWKQISPEVDRIRVMAYHYHYTRTSPGAVSPPERVRQLARYALEQVPAEKLEIALPIYGFDWTGAGQGQLVATVADYKQLARQANAWEFRDPETQSARIDYFTSEGKGKHRRLVRHHVWYEDAASVTHKIQLLQRLGVRHIGLWQMAVGDLSELFKLAGSSVSSKSSNSPL